MTLLELKSVLKDKQSYLKKGTDWLSEHFNCSLELAEKAKKEVKDELKGGSEKPKKTTAKDSINLIVEKIKSRNPGINIVEQIKKYNKKTYRIAKTGDPDNVLFIGDLHAPFILDGYLDFNLDLQKKYNCGTIIFAGDIIDSNSWSYHEHNPDGMSVRDELAAAKSQLVDWYKAFPKASVLFGNHDLLIARKARTIGLSQLFLKYFGDVVDAPKTWSFVNELYRDKVLYVHGSVGNAIKRATSIRHSVAQGHLHSQAFVEWSVSEIDSIFGLQVGCGIDRKEYAFQYAVDMPKKPIISSGLILEKGRLPVLELMSL